MMAHPESTLGAVHFDVENTTGTPKINYIIQSNSTVSIRLRSSGINSDSLKQLLA